MAMTPESRRTVFRQIAHCSYVDWPTYGSSPLFDRSSLPALESDVRVVAKTWFQQDEHEGVEPFVHTLPLAYVQFDPYDRYAGSTSYEMETLFRLFLLKECHGWDHETALEAHQKLRLVFSMHTVPDSDGRSGSVKIRRVLFGQCSICIDHNPIRIYHLLRIPIESAQPMSPRSRSAWRTTFSGPTS